jgi:hypothetical protein
MTEPPKRSRGRPKGSGKDDSALLSAVADLVLIDAIKPTTAMKRLIRQGIEKKTILDSERAATLRRLQEKWKESPETLKAQAQARLDAKKEKEEQERRQRRSSGRRISHDNMRDTWGGVLGQSLNQFALGPKIPDWMLAATTCNPAETYDLQKSAWQKMAEAEDFHRKINQEDSYMKIMREQDRIYKMMTGTYDPLTGRFK